MKLYLITKNGDIESLKKLDFNSDDLYLVHDSEKNVIYLWVGKYANQERINTAAEISRKINKKENDSCKILVMEQENEYGSFLAIMADLKKGLLPGISVERRPEFKLIDKEQVEYFPKESEEILVEKSGNSQNKITERILSWWNQVNLQLGETKSIELLKKDSEALKSEEIGLESKIREAAYFISLENYSYNELCWFLAEKILNINMKMPSLKDIRTKAKEIYESSSTYDELCWLNGELDILIKEGYLEPQKPIKWANYS
jgi:hypothetical protein